MPAWIARLLQHKYSLLSGILIALFAVATQLYAFSLGDKIRYPDEAEYLRLARNLVDSGHYTLDGSTPTAYRPPAYPLMLAAGMKLGLPVVALRMANTATLLVCIALLYRLILRTSATQAKIAVLMVMAYPVLLYTANTFYPQIPSACLLLAVVLTLFSAPMPGARRFLFSGILLGIAILLVPTFIFTLLFTPLFFAGHLRRREWIRSTASMAVGALLVLSPWIARNAMVFGRFIPISTNNGISLLTGNNEEATPNSGVTVGLARHLLATKDLPEIEADEYYRRTALDYIRSHPRDAFTLYIAKAANYYNFRNKLAIQSESSPTRDLIMLITYGTLLGTALLRIALWKRHPLSHLERYTISLYCLNGLFSALFFTRIRFRIPMDLLLIVVASAGLSILIHKWANSPRRAAT